LQSSPNGSAADVFTRMKASATTLGQEYSAASAWHHILLYLWSLAVGASVAACGVFSLRLNGHVQPGRSEYHAIYIATISIAIGGLLLLPSALMNKEPWGKPRSRYSLLGGVMIVAEFVTVPAFRHLGVKIVLLAMLSGMLAGGMVFDCASRKLRWSEPRRIVGFSIVLIAVVLNYGGDILFPTAGAEVKEFTAESFMWVIISVFCGFGYALMAKCNSQLALELGSASRATVVCAVVVVICRIPLMWWIYVGKGIHPELFASDWPWWLLASAQSALYNGSLAVLPGLLGYTVNYFVMLVGKLAFGAVIDAAGWTGHVVKLDLSRILSMLLVMAGVLIFTVKSWTEVARGMAGYESEPENKSEEDFDLVQVVDAVCSDHEEDTDMTK